ncbi:MAG: hypothetical protein GX100_03000 [candidate division WS1 bacterium]|jgi:Tfp pilus assembly protein PilO|nr:hypothetical protein [candidate division WS1 bacterium]
MGKIPWYAIVIVGVVLILGLSFAAWHFMVKPRTAERDAAQQTYTETKAKADTLEAKRTEYINALAQYETGTLEWQQLRDKIKDVTRRRSIPLSFNVPMVAMIRLWMYYRDPKELPELIRDWVTKSGCTLTSGLSLGAPPGPPPPAAPNTGFMKIPDSVVNLEVRGNLETLERLYASLPQLPRIATIEALNLTAVNDVLTATIPMSIYLLVEVPAAAAGGGAAAGAPEGPPGAGMPGEPPMGPEGAPPPGGPGGPPPDAGGGMGGDMGGGMDE